MYLKKKNHILYKIFKSHKLKKEQGIKESIMASKNDDQKINVKNVLVDRGEYKLNIKYELFQTNNDSNMKPINILIMNGACFIIQSHFTCNRCHNNFCCCLNVCTFVVFQKHTI